MWTPQTPSLNFTFNLTNQLSLLFSSSPDNHRGQCHTLSSTLLHFVTEYFPITVNIFTGFVVWGFLCMCGFGLVCFLLCLWFVGCVCLIVFVWFVCFFGFFFFVFGFFLPGTCCLKCQFSYCPRGPSEHAVPKSSSPFVGHSAPVHVWLGYSSLFCSSKHFSGEKRTLSRRSFHEVSPPSSSLQLGHTAV